MISYFKNKLLSYFFDLEAFNKQLDAAKDDKERLELVKKVLTELAETNNELRKENEELKILNMTLKERIAELNRKIATQEESINNLTGDMDEAIKLLTKLKNERDEAIRKLNEQTTTHDNDEAENIKELDKAEEVVARIEVKINAFRDKLSQFK